MPAFRAEFRTVSATTGPASTTGMLLLFQQLSEAFPGAFGEPHSAAIQDPIRWAIAFAGGNGAGCAY